MSMRLAGLLERTVYLSYLSLLVQLGAKIRK